MRGESRSLPGVNAETPEEEILRGFCFVRGEGKTERVRGMDGRRGGTSTSGRSIGPRDLRRTGVRLRSTNRDIPSHLHSHAPSPFVPSQPQPNPPSAAGSGHAKEYAYCSDVALRRRYQVRGAGGRRAGRPSKELFTCLRSSPCALDSLSLMHCHNARSKTRPHRIYATGRSVGPRQLPVNVGWRFVV